MGAFSLIVVINLLNREVCYVMSELSLDYKTISILTAVMATSGTLGYIAAMTRFSSSGLINKVIRRLNRRLWILSKLVKWAKRWFSAVVGNRRSSQCATGLTMNITRPQVTMLPL